ncbi:MAG: hypothetical protein KDA27_12585 [Candidatus Eisenbacteria bacterium]|uniref:Uncharacterized protein n=1 Tax=Eiseniibacteriota bacterium TaxID=2212470 RepID=A0A956NCG3_UNCEI|nr:hypothetical protein [Candidatus Eisenbacteria bacterium]
MQQARPGASAGGVRPGTVLASTVLAGAIALAGCSTIATSTKRHTST